MDINKIFFEFSNEGRYQVFRSLCKENKKHSELERELNIPGSEISRHLSRLQEKNLIVKREDNKYGISNIGQIFYQIMDLFEVATKHKDFFNTHDINIVPLYLMLQLGALKTIETSNKTLQNIELWSDLVKNSERFIFAISDQFQNSLLPIVEKKITDQLIDIRALVDKNLLKLYRIPEEWAQKFKDPLAFYKKIKIFENIRILNQINFSLVVSDKGAILFLSRDGEIDYNQCLIDNNESFINWTKELFEFCWKKGKDLKSFIKSEIESNVE